MHILYEYVSDISDIANRAHSFGFCNVGSQFLEI